MANRVYNFAAGPAAMPLPVLEQAARELTDCGGTGMSVMEMSHRSPAFEEIIASAEAGLRRLMTVSYTHLDVYKRQVLTMPSIRPLRLTNQLLMMAL